jgi:hypothetical protein
MLFIALACAPAYAEGPIAASLARCFDVRQPCETLDPGRFLESDAPDAAGVSRNSAEQNDRKFQFMLGAFVTAAGSDLAMSMYHIGKGTARERGFGAWWQDSPVAFGITKSGSMAVVVYGLHRIHKTNPKAAFVLGIVATSVEAALVARSAVLSRQRR